MPNLEDAPMLVTLAGQFLAQSVGYFAVVGTVFLMVWKLGKQRFAGRKIQAVNRVDGAQIKFEIKHTLLVLAFGTLNAVLIGAMVEAGWMTEPGAAEGWTPLGIVGLVVGLIVFNDFWFYCVHRTLHHPKLFKHIHAVHHRSIDTSPFTSYSFHVVEGALINLWIFPFFMLFEIPLVAIAIVFVIGTANNVMAHLGYEFLPKWWVKVPLLKWTNTATFHSLHHAKSHGNYGLFSRVWDRLLGTELPGYEERFVAREAPSKEAETIPHAAPVGAR